MNIYTYIYLFRKTLHIYTHIQGAEAKIGVF